MNTRWNKSETNERMDEQSKEKQTSVANEHVVIKRSETTQFNS